MADSRIVGIDLGTTNSLVAFMEGGVPVIIPGEDGSNLVPSVVALDEHNKIIVGNSARKYLIETPDRAIYSIKRLMGRGVEDIHEELKLFPFRLADDLQPGEVLRIRLGDKTFTPPEISAFILRQLKRNAERFFGAPVSKAVITVPAYFNDAQRQATKDAGRIAGLEVVATNGDTHLGGDDIDNLLIRIALDDIRGDMGLDVSRNGEAVATIRKAVIEAKIALSSQRSTTLDLGLP